MNIFKILVIIFCSITIIGAYITYCWTSIFMSSAPHTANTNNDQKKSLTIFMVTNNYHPYSGGVVTSIDSYAHELRQQGHKVIIVTLDFLGATEPSQDVIRIESPIRFKYCNNHMAIPWRPTQVLFNLAQKYKPDIIHTFHPFLLGPCALHVGTQLNIPVVFTHMTLYDQYLHYVPIPKIFTQPITNYLVHNFCNKVSTLIVPSYSTQNYIEAQGINRPMSKVSLSVLPQFLKETFELKKKNQHDRFTLLFVSRFTPEKNIHFLLDAFKLLDQSKYKFVLIGYGVQEKELQEYAYNKLQLSKDAVTFYIKPEKSVIRDWYDKANLFIFASKTDTQGLVLAEAMARGTPVVALKASGVIDIIQQGMNGFMIEDINEMAQKINEIAHDSLLYEKMQYQAWLTGSSYSPQKCTEQLLNVYYQTIASTGSTASGETVN
jgi:1,2-diacylglycerol 3-alpha-glucosyltransferase